MKALTIINPPIRAVDDELLKNIEDTIRKISKDDLQKLVKGIEIFKLGNGSTLKVLGKGDEGTVYGIRLNNGVEFAIKFFTDKNNKEIMILQKLMDLYKRKIIMNVVMLYKYFESNGFLITIMNKADGTINDWINKKIINSESIDNAWLTMMMQILYAVLILKKKLKLYHKDLLHRNILYKTYDKPINITYKLKFKDKYYEFSFTTYTIFYVSDFGKSQSLLFDDNILTSVEIKEALVNNADLYGVSSLYNKIFVDYIYHHIDHKKLYSFILGNKVAHEYLDGVRKHMEEKAKKISKPHWYIQTQVVRALCYYLIENNLFDTNLVKSKLNVPSRNVVDILHDLPNKKSIIGKMIGIQKLLH